MKRALVNLGVGLVAALSCLSELVHAEENSRTDQNLQKVIDAARELAWPEHSPDQRPFLLVKTRTIRSPVALVFGYADNFEACLEIAADLTAAANVRALSPGPDLYVCDAIY